MIEYGTMPKALSFYLFAIGSLLLYSLMTYALERDQFTELLISYLLLFLIAYQLIQRFSPHFWALAGLALLFRLALLPSIPNLSQDFYRFLWDGRLLVQGINPYLTTPEQYLDQGLWNIVPQARELVTGMGTLNASHYSNYPPLNQLCFAIAALLSGQSILGSVIVLRLQIIGAELGILWFGKRLLEQLNLPVQRIYWYILNPFVIIEMSGNLHFESVMLFFLLLGIYWLHRKRWILSAFAWTSSIAVKLLPLLLLPVLIQHLSRWNQKESYRKLFSTSWKSIPYYGLVLLTSLVFFLPVLSGEFITHFGDTIALWFQKFEFNASVYYLIRWVGYQVKGWNIIGEVGPILPVVTVIFLIGLSLLRNNRGTRQWLTAALFGVCFYFLLSTTVHPWYVATPLLLCIFTRYRFPVLWSFTVFLSYSAYGATEFSERPLLIALEYLTVIGLAIYELRQAYRWGSARKPHLTNQ
ncbi:mannosyltransferase [Croceiramulus getboli]|nr:mannosyltransferase [Flavobacteriaceae bacterium YJPT1-3]